MGVQLNIKDPETVRLARELAGQTQRSVTETIRTALEHALEEREVEVQRRIADMEAYLADLRLHLPAEWKGRSSKEIMDDIYNDDGSFAS